PKLLDYANRNGMSWTYWCLNPNSGDTKGLFLDDWTTIDTVRYDVIKPFLTPLKGSGPGPTYYTLTVQKAGQGLGAVSGGAISCGAACSASLESGTVVTLTASPEVGSAFAGWSGACAGTGACTVTMTAARTVTATFNPIIAENYTLTVVKTGSGSGTVTGAGISCGATCTASYPAGASVTLTATPAAGSALVRWTCASGVVMDANKTCTAQFDLVIVDDPVLTVTKAGLGTGVVTSSPSGINCGTTCAAAYSAGTVVTLTAAASTGSSFTGWSGACVGTGSCVVTMAAARSVTATFQSACVAVVVQVTKAGTGTGSVVSSPAGIDCGPTCSAPMSFCGGQTLTLTATAAAGSRFAGWSGGCTGSASTCIANPTIPTVATFEPVTTTPCANPVTFTHNTGNFNTTGAVCYRTSQRVNGWGCSNFAGRTISVNGAATTCGAGPFPLAQSGGYTYFSATAGSYPWASIYIW
ncbi:MAG TPA: hypothetical protein VEB43_04235, partial [Anaeromyxobacter sp.]|nr:hypothetical protein [Anaeromyxobacter sp.]